MVRNHQIPAGGTLTTTELFTDDPRECPACCDGAIVPIIYGPASHEMKMAAHLGQIVLAETPATDGSPQWMCQKPSCLHQF
jgi:hypothetical protein